MREKNPINIWSRYTFIQFEVGKRERKKIKSFKFYLILESSVYISQSLNENKFSLWPVFVWGLIENTLQSWDSINHIHELVIIFFPTQQINTNKLPELLIFFVKILDIFTVDCYKRGFCLPEIKILRYC